MKYYETKQYKKALKAADQVLKKFPDHGETLSMKVQQPRLSNLPTPLMPSHAACELQLGIPAIMDS